jgi:hypothetical protein
MDVFIVHSSGGLDGEPVVEAFASPEEAHEFASSLAHRLPGPGVVSVSHRYVGRVFETMGEA